MISILAAAVPDQLTSITTTFTTSNLKVMFDWTALATLNANGAAVSEYRVTFLNKLNNAYETNTACDGTDGGIISATACEVLMTEFISNQGYVGG